MSIHRRLVVLSLSALLVAGCGGSGTKDAATTTTVTSKDLTNPASTNPSKTRAAKAAVLKQSDFPAGWKLQDPQDGLDVETMWRDLTRCLGVERKGRPLGLATSGTYLQNLATQTRSTVEYMPTSAIKAVSAALAGPKFNDCATKAFTADTIRNAPDGGTPGPVTVTPLTFAPLGQSTSASRANVTMTLGDLPVPINQDLIVVFNGQAVTRMMFLNPGRPFPPDLQRSLVQQVVGRAT